MFAGNFAPRGWALCEGQLLAISTNQALFSILGTTYGGDGRTTFALPDLRGRVPIGPGTGPGLSTYRLGQKGGAETNTMLVNNIPAMSYGVPAYEASELNGGTMEKGNKAVLTTGSEPNTTFKTTINGRGQYSNIMQPYTGMNYIICLTGTYPSRS
ncbi:phage tail protein [Winogradskyella poriferorum]|uniref:phage tail protein n=1 Tax=Winogradskyella poriferorum TaxID=307627 RepID=UPI003D64933F